MKEYVLAISIGNMLEPMLNDLYAENIFTIPIKYAENKHNDTILNSRQRLMLNKLLDGFDGKLKSSKWAKITKCSADTALRDIKDLIEKGILKQEDSGGRSANYELIDF